MRNMIDKILPREEADFYAGFDRKIQKMRSGLKHTQSGNLLRQEESLKATKWRDKRRRDVEKTM